MDLAIYINELLGLQGEVNVPGVGYFAQKRIADIAIDFYAMACILSRVTQALEEKGDSQCELELAIADAFFMKANRRIRGNFKAMERNEDDSMKTIANFAYQSGVYPFDVL